MDALAIPKPLQECTRFQKNVDTECWAHNTLMIILWAAQALLRYHLSGSSKHSASLPSYEILQCV